MGQIIFSGEVQWRCSGGAGGSAVQGGAKVQDLEVQECSSVSRNGSWSSVSILGGATSSELCNNRQ